MPETGDNDELEPQELKHLRIREISLVDRPANKRTFLLFKSDGAEGDSIMPTLTGKETAAIEEALNTGFDGEEDVLKAMEARAKDGKLSEKARNALKGALRLIGAHTELSDVMKADSEDPKPEPKPENEPKPEPEAKLDETPEVTPDIPASVEKVLKAEREAHKAELAKRDVVIAELKKFQVEMVAKADLVEVEKLVDTMNLPSMSREDQIKLVRSWTPEQREKFAGWAEGLTKSIDLSTPIGSPRRGVDVPESAQDETMRLANARVEKDASGKLDLADAIVKVRAERPDLAARSRLEALGQGG